MQKLQMVGIAPMRGKLIAHIHTNKRVDDGWMVEWLVHDIVHSGTISAFKGCHSVSLFFRSLSLSPCLLEFFIVIL